MGMMTVDLMGERGRCEESRAPTSCEELSRASVVTAVDVGVSKTVCALAVMSGARADLIGAGVIASPNAASGKAADFIQAVRALRLAADEAERSAGVAVTEAVASYSGPDLGTIIVEGRVQAKAGVVSAKDEAKAVQAAVAAARDPAYRILHTAVLGFRVDGGARVAEPRGLEGRRLAAEVAVVRAPTAHLAALVQCAGEAGLVIRRIVAGPLAAGLAALDPDDRDGALVIDLGAGGVGLALFGAQGLVYASTLKGGGVRVTRSVAAALDTSFAAAEKAKILYASDCGLADRRDTVETPRLGPDGRLEPARVLRRAIQDAAGDRLDAIFADVARTLRRAGFALPAHAVLVGGGAHLAGAAEIASARLGAPVVVGGVCTIPGLEQAMSSAPFATAAGLLRWIVETPPSAAPALSFSASSRRSAQGGQAALLRAWRWLQESF
ncbi:MAG: cell division protein FtsA [Alphaproteobacteria bacterium]|nr:cell division protein FtsA [Alphaproteobacteria bacterium]